jgi:restriction system protein
VLEKRVFHPGLKTFRVVRGTDPTTVDFLAKWQMEAWEERWRKIQTAAEKRSRDEQAASQSSGKKSLAQRSTREAERQLQGLTKILRDGIEIDRMVDWEILKHRFEFSEAAPKPPKPDEPPPEPEPKETKFVPVLTYLDRLISSRARRKQSAAQQLYLLAKADWEDANRRVQEVNRAKRAEHEANLQKWRARKAEHDGKQA